MVERPIKKSERQSQANTDGNSSNSRVKPSGKPQRKGAKGKRKKASFLKDESKPPVNPALARPPKPPKPKAEPEQEAEPEVEVTASSEVETTAPSEEEQEQNLAE